MDSLIDSETKQEMNEEWMTEWMNGWMDECMQTKKRVSEWKDEWMDGWMNEWMNEWTMFCQTLLVTAARNARRYVWAVRLRSVKLSSKIAECVRRAIAELEQCAQGLS